MRDRIIQLQESAEDLGFGSIQQALDAGYHEVQDLEHNTFKLEKIDEQEEAHKAWLNEREEVLGELISVYNDIDVPKDLKKYIKHAIEFVKKGEC
jgi:hypothetical protein